MGFFGTNWRDQGTKLTPPEKRSVSFLDWIASLLSGLQSLMDNNVSWEEEIRRRSLYNAQKIVLQDALNTIFTTTGIIVETQTGQANDLYIYNESEGLNDPFTYNESESIGLEFVFVYNESETVDVYNFLIKIPAGFYTAEIDRRVRAEVNKYKLGGKTFNVITY